MEKLPYSSVLQIFMEKYVETCL